MRALQARRRWSKLRACIAGLLALLLAAMFVGAIYINFAEDPARLHLDDRSLLRQWKPSYSRGYRRQASLAVLSGLCGIVAYWQQPRGGWIAGAVLIREPAVYDRRLDSLNKRLMAMPEEAADDSASTAALHRWGRLHAVRSALASWPLVLLRWARAVAR